MLKILISLCSARSGTILPYISMRLAFVKYVGTQLSGLKTGWNDTYLCYGSDSISASDVVVGSATSVIPVL